MTYGDDMKKNLLTLFFAGCGLLCAQVAWSADKAPLPSKMAFSPKKPIKFSMRIETASEDAVYSCNRILKFYMADYKVSSKSGKNGPPWVVEINKEYAPPFADVDKIVQALRGTPCGTSGDFSWTVSQEATVHEGAKPKDAKAGKP